MATYYWTKEQRANAAIFVDPVTGADTNDGTANQPKKNLSGLTVGVNIALPSVKFVGAVSFTSGSTLWGTGETEFNGTTIAITGNRNRLRLINCTLHSSNNTSQFNNCFIKNCSNIIQIANRCIIKGTTVQLSTNYYPSHQAMIYDSCVLDWTVPTLVSATILQNHIYYNSYIRLGTSYTGINSFAYNIIHPNCHIAIGTGEFKTISTIEAETGLTGMAAIEAAYKAIFPSGYLSSVTNKVADPLFVDVANENYSVLSNSPCIGFGRNGYTNVGNVQVGRKINIVSDSKQLTSCIDTESAVNATFVTDQISSDSVNDMVVKSQIIEFSDIVEVGKIVANYTDSQSTGELLDTQLPYDIAAPISAGTALEDAQLYVVRTTSITYASVVRTVGAIFKASGTDSFTGSGVVHKITELPNYKTFGMRWSNNSGNELSAGDTLTEGAEYLVKYDTITYDGVERPIGSSFCCKTGITTITGVGKVVEIFTDLDAFSQFLINKKPAVKRVGNIETGAIEYTNGQKEYHTSENDARPDFFIKAKFIQLLFSTKTNSLK